MALILIPVRLNVSNKFRTPPRKTLGTHMPPLHALGQALCFITSRRSNSTFSDPRVAHTLRSILYCSAEYLNWRNLCCTIPYEYDLFTLRNMQVPSSKAFSRERIVVRFVCRLERGANVDLEPAPYGCLRFLGQTWRRLVAATTSAAS